MNDVYKTRTWTGKERGQGELQREEEVDGVAGDVGPAPAPAAASAIPS